MASSVIEKPIAMVSWLYLAVNDSCATSYEIEAPSFLTGAASKPESATSSSKPSLSAAQEHRWHYFPGMRRDECLLFVSGDTAGGWPSVPHTAFAHPTTTADDPSRRSVEARVFVLYK